MFDFTIEGNSLVITDTSSSPGEIIFEEPAKAFYFSNADLSAEAGKLSLNKIDAIGSPYISELFTDCLIEGAAVTEATARAFQRASLGL